jgi:thioredoxin reductase
MEKFGKALIIGAGIGGLTTAIAESVVLYHTQLIKAKAITAIYQILNINLTLPLIA